MPAGRVSALVGLSLSLCCQAKAKEGGKALVVEGERFTVRKIPDPSMGGMTVSAFLAPEKWRDQSHVVWNYGNDVPVTAWGSAEERGVETLEDPAYGTSQHSNTEQYHWTDGYGSYRHTNDPSVDPNRTDNGGWTLMKPAR